LRVRALGPRPYPVLTCKACFHLTGWLSARGSCDACVRHDAFQAAFSDPHGGWVSMAPTVPAASATRRARGRFAGLLTGHGRDERLVESWLRHVEPGDTGPIEPEAGYELEVAVRDEVELTDGTGMLVRFAIAAHRFDGGNWARLAGTRVTRSAIPNPTGFAAALPVEQLVEAWGDYQAAVAGFNRAAWARLSEQRDAERRAQEERDAALAEQRHTVDLLQEDR
jgi:hypothetical protein